MSIAVTSATTTSATATPKHPAPTCSSPYRLVGTRLVACALVLVLMAAACGSAGDDPAQQVVAQGEPAGQDGDGQGGTGDAGDTDAPPTTEPVSPPAVTPTPQRTDDSGEPTPIQSGEAPASPAPQDPVAPTPTAPPQSQEPSPVPTPDESLGNEPIPVETPDLIGREWFVVSVEPADPPRPTGAVARLSFNPDGTVSGNAGCNDFSGSYTIDGANLRVANLAITERACFIGDWSAFVQALPLVTGYGSAGGPDPILFTPGGSIALGSTPPGGPTGPAEPNPAAVDQYIGLSEIEAAQLADANGVAFRVASIDGEPQMLTMDYVADRVNVDLVAGVVVGATLG